MKTPNLFHPSPTTLHLPGVAPDPDAQEELTWFFNGALRDLERPLRLCPNAYGLAPDALWPIEVRAEILHAASKIHARLRAMPEPEMRALQALYAERMRPRRVERSLGRLAGPVEIAPAVVAAHRRALARDETRAQDVTAWLDELLARGERTTVRAWRRTAIATCAAAIATYLRVRGRGPSVVPIEVL